MPKKSSLAASLGGTRITSVLLSETRLLRTASTETENSGETNSFPYDELDYDILFQMLSNERRRKVIRHLSDEQSTITLSCIAEHIAATENDCSVKGINSQERKRTYVALYQCHLPKMADSGLIEYDSDRGTIGPGPHLDIANEYLSNPSASSEIPPLAYTAPPMAVGISALLLFSSALMGLAFAGITLCLTLIVVMTMAHLGHTGI